MGDAKVNEFLAHLAVKQEICGLLNSEPALAALLFPYSNLLRLLTLEASTQRLTAVRLRLEFRQYFSRLAQQRRVGALWLSSWPQSRACQEIGKSFIGAKSAEHGVDLHIHQPNVALFIGFLEPFEGLIFIAQAGVNRRHCVG